MFVNYTSEQEVHNILKSLNPRKSAGVDGIRSIDLKNYARSLPPAITTLINSSLAEPSIPKILKTSIIRPINKGGENGIIRIIGRYLYFRR